MAEIGSAFVSIVPSARGFGRKLDGQVGPDLDRSGKAGGSRFGRALGSSAGANFKRILGPALALVGTAAVGGFLKDSIAEARESQKVGALTANVIKTTGGVAKISAKQVGNLSTAISNKTGIDDEAVQSGSNLLLTFKNVRNEAGKGANVFDRATQAAVDLSASGFGDLNGASKQLGKALNDPVKGITALGRSGVTFSETQKDQIKGFVKSNDLLSAQKIILKEVESQVGGSAAAQATAGEKAKVAYDNLKETIGTALLPVIDRLATIISTKVVPTISDFIHQMQDGTGVGGKVADVFKVVGSVLGTVFDFIKNNKAVVATFVGVVVGLTAAFAALNLVLAINPITLVVLAIAALAAGFVYAYKKSETFRTIVDGVWSFLKPLATFLGEKMPGVLRIVGLAFLTYAGLVVKVFHFMYGVVLDVFGGILKAASKAFGWVPGLGGKIKAASKGFDAMKDAVDSSLTAVESKLKSTQEGLNKLGRSHAKPFVYLDTKGVTAGFKYTRDTLNKIGRLSATAKASIHASNVGNNAKGTNNWRGGLTWVGEEGPELINLARGAQVIPNNKIDDVSPSGGRGSAVVAGSGMSARDFEAAMLRALTGADFRINGQPARLQIAGA